MFPEKNKRPRYANREPAGSAQKRRHLKPAYPLPPFLGGLLRNKKRKTASRYRSSAPPISQLNRVLDARPALHGRERVRPLRHDLRRRRQRGGRLRILPIIIVVFIIQLELVRVAVPVVLRHVVADPPPLLPLAPPAPNRAPQRRSALPVQLARHEAAHAAPVRRARRFLHDALRLVHAVRVAVSMAVTGAVTGAVTIPMAMARTQLAVPSPILWTLLRGPLARFRAALPELLRHLAVELLGLVEGLVDLPDGAEDVGRDGGRGRARGGGGRGGDVGARGDGEGARGRC